MDSDKIYNFRIPYQKWVGYWLILSAFILCIFSFSVMGVRADTVSAPTITEVEAISTNVKPLIKGTTQNGTLVHIYIDGVYNGKTKVLFSGSGTANFAYESFINLSSGDHTVWAVAEDEGGSKSELSNIFKFNILPGVPAPTIFQPAINKNDISHPFINGLSKNDLTINIYIDDQLDGEFKVENHESGTASFSYQASRALARGQHTAYVTAKDNQGRESKKSNIVNFNVADPSIAESINEEDMELDDEQKITDEDIDKLIKEGLEDGKNDEDKEKKNKLSPSLIIFILFIVGIIGWIIWVNRALIKEKKTHVKKDNNQKDDKNLNK